MCAQMSPPSGASPAGAFRGTQQQAGAQSVLGWPLAQAAFEYRQVCAAAARTLTRSSLSSRSLHLAEGVMVGSLVPRLRFGSDNMIDD